MMRSSFRQQLVKYAWVLGWLMRDFVWRYRWRAGSLAALRFGGMFLQLSTFGVLAKYARMLETDATLTLPWGEPIQARDSMLLLGLVGLAALVAMVVGSTLTFLSTQGMERLCAAYEIFCGKRVLQIAGRSTRLDRPPMVEGDDEQLILRLSKPYPRLLRRMTKTMLTSLLPSVLVVLLVIPILLMLNVWLTLLVAVLVAASLTAHYRLNVRAAQSSLTIERTARESLDEFRNVLGRIRQYIEPLDDASIEKPFAAKALRRNMDAYFTRVTVSSESQFVTDCLTAVILVAVLVTLGGSILRHGEGWASLLVYLLALRYSMAQLKGALVGFSGIARFFHQARAYFLFITSEHDPIDAERTEEIDHLTIRCTSDDPLPDSLDTMTVRGGDRVAVFGPFQPTRFQSRALYGVLVGEDTATIRAAMSRTSLVADREGLLACLEGEAHPPAANAAAASPMKADATETAVATLDRTAAPPGPLNVVIAGERTVHVFQELDKAAARNAKSGVSTPPASSCLTLLLISKPPLLDQANADVIVVTDGDSVIWLGRKDQLPLIAGLLTAAGQERGTAANELDEDEEQNPSLDDAL